MEDKTIIERILTENLRPGSAGATNDSITSSDISFQAFLKYRQSSL